MQNFPAHGTKTSAGISAKAQTGRKQFLSEYFLNKKVISYTCARKIKQKTSQKHISVLAS